MPFTVRLRFSGALPFELQGLGEDGRIRTYYSKETVLQTAATLQRCRIPI